MSKLYFRDGVLLAKSGEARLYRMNKGLYLEIGPGHTLWALESEMKDYIWQISDKPRGNCLEIGLGLGMASRYILSLPKVKHLTTVEINPDVIKVHDKVCEVKGDWYGYDPSKHTIINANGLVYTYVTKRRYDFVFLDFYDRIDEDTLPQIEDMINGCKGILNQGGYIMGWFDSYTPETDAGKFFKLFKEINSKL